MTNYERTRRRHQERLNAIPPINTLITPPELAAAAGLKHTTHVMESMSLFTLDDLNEIQFLEKLSRGQIPNKEFCNSMPYEMYWLIYEPGRCSATVYFYVQLMVILERKEYEQYWVPSPDGPVLHTLSRQEGIKLLKQLREEYFGRS
jgi:hypothetical protein